MKIQKNGKSNAALLPILGITVVLSGALISCNKLDVVGKESKTSFYAVLETQKDKIVYDEMNGGWVLNAPDGGAAFLWSKDYRSSPMHDVMLVVDAEPFLAAGLDTDKLPDNYAVYDSMDGMQGKLLMVGKKLGDEKLNYSGDATPQASYDHLLKLKRKSIGYHAALDHYNIDIGDGNLFEWAKDLNTNDKDIVFVLDPIPLVSAGVDPALVQNWTFTKVPLDINGKPTEADKFLKFFNLR